MSHHPIEVHDEERPAEDAVVREGLAAYNRAAAEFGGRRPLRCFARDPDGRVVAGALGFVWGESAELGQIWVEETRRRSGLGSRVLEAFESAAAERGARLVYFDTWSFHAPAFYRAHGYEVACEIPGFPDAAVLYIMRKSLR